MTSYTLLISLLASSFISTEAIWFGSSNEPDDSVDPVTRLSDVLVQLTDDKTLAGNIDAALEHNWQADFQEFNQPSFQQAVMLFLELNGQDISDPINLVNAKKLRELAGEDNIGFRPRRGQRRVFAFLKKLENQLSDDGFDTYDELWESDESRNAKFQKQFPGLAHLSSLLASLESPLQAKLDGDFKDLSGVISLYKRPASDEALKVEEVVSVMSAIHKMKRYKNGLKLNAKYGLTAEKLLNDYLVHPCEALLEQPEAETIFEPIKNLALYVDLEEAAKAHDGPFESGSLFWTSRYIFCEVLVKRTNLRNLAEKLAKS